MLPFKLNLEVTERWSTDDGIMPPKRLINQNWPTFCSHVNYQSGWKEQGLIRTLSILELLDLVLEYISLKVWVVAVLRRHLFAGFPGSNLHQMRYKPLFIVLQTLY